MKIVDARGKTCPQPVILTKKEVDLGEKEITIIVDNDTAKSNVIKLGAKFKFEYKEEKTPDGIYIILTKSGAYEKCESIASKPDEIMMNKGFVFGSDVLGKGSDELGKMLMNGFIYTVTETKPYPKFMVFLNSGVRLTSEGSSSIDDLIKLESQGVKIVSCGTCLDYFNLKDKLLVGQISNMYDIVEIITNSDNAVML